jgi:peptidoglycan hydrolase FlgJ
MEISKISDVSINNTIDNTKNKVTDDSFEAKLQSAMNTKDDTALKSACNDFEGIMLGMMYKEMKATIQKSDLMPEDSGTDIYDSMLDDQLMNEVSKSGGIGLAEVLYKQLSKNLDSTGGSDNGGVSASAEKK